MKRILLMGNPNVGKSAVFSRLTGVGVVASNYPGTTVSIMKGRVSLPSGEAEVIDVPGVYDLEASTKAEEAAVSMLGEGDVILDIVDSTSLERNLNLTLQLLERGRPSVIVLNMWDETSHRGIKIDAPKLENILGVPVVPVCAVTGEGIKKLRSSIEDARASSFTSGSKDIWAKIGKIIADVQVLTHRHHTLWERLGEASIRPVTGFPIAALTAFIVFKIVRFTGEGLINTVFDPFFTKLWAPLIGHLAVFTGGHGFLHDIFIGKLINGEIDFVQSMGLLTTGLYVPFAMVLPYVFAFYLVLGFLEDSGYLPRISILADNLMHRVGLHGLALIPMTLGLGCNVPAALGARTLETKRERFIASTLIAIAVPCMAQTAMIVGLAGNFGAKALALIFGTLFLVWLFLGIILSFVLKGTSPEIFVEIPPYRLPYFGALVKKVLMRVRWFISEAVPFVMLGVFIVNILYSLGVIAWLGRLVHPVVTGVMGLPDGAVAALIIGFLRKDVAVGMLAPLGLNMKQTVIACIALAMYFPCVATFAVLLKEMGIVDMLKSMLIMVISTLIVTGLLNLIL